jgi:hypothetical protein
MKNLTGLLPETTYWWKNQGSNLAKIKLLFWLCLNIGPELGPTD